MRRAFGRARLQRPRGRARRELPLRRGDLRALPRPVPASSGTPRAQGPAHRAGPRLQDRPGQDRGGGRQHRAARRNP
ncbi:MAG: hypothetical protein N2507_04495 [Candidatus Bipolaricaulota bacterium]|nr:hypothetical protein [Candidatus Bipolaricaulota bacterium]